MELLRLDVILDSVLHFDKHSRVISRVAFLSRRWCTLLKARDHTALIRTSATSRLHLLKHALRLWKDSHAEKCCRKLKRVLLLLGQLHCQPGSFWGLFKVLFWYIKLCINWNQGCFSGELTGTEFHPHLFFRAGPSLSHLLSRYESPSIFF